ncbi:MAG: hypothetical protein ACAI25_00545 [Planctomycetota bacterium]
MQRAGAAFGFAILAVALAAPFARSEDEVPTISEPELKALAERALAAAVTSSGKSTFALDDAAVSAQGGAKVEQVVAALRASAGKAKLIKHTENLDAPMIRARFSTLSISNAKESMVDHGLYLELEGSNRALLHANVTNLRKSGPGGKVAGHHTATTLDNLADLFVSEKWLKDPPPSTYERVTIVGKASTNSTAQQSLVERVIQRLVAAKAQVIAARVGAVDVERPKNVRLLGAQMGILVALANEADETWIEGSDLAKGGTVYRFHYPFNAAGAGAGIAVKHMKTLARSVEFEFRNDNYRIKPAGPKGKVWILEAKVDAGGDALKNQLTVAARSELVGKEAPHWLHEAKDGAVTIADAKAAGIDVLVTPILRPGKGNKKQVALELRTVADDQVYAEPAANFSEDRPK